MKLISVAPHISAQCHLHTKNEVSAHLVFHPELDEGGRDEDGGPAQPGHAVDADAGVGVGEELLEHVIHAQSSNR